ncbi:MAG: T9SS type A sorting domain-containing protein [Flavobacteriales bacterium]|nr:T9SS type A sorting domain-containing protein [Flavobacteriales bacterium]
MRILFSLLLVLSLNADAATIKSLFIGNSYTYYNTLPNVVSDVAASMGHSLIFDSSAPGGYTFNQHTSNATTLQKIAADEWDFVILQEQSQIPSFPLSQVEQDCFPYAEQLCNLIREANPCARPLFYMTWGRENGDSQNCANWPPVCTYQGMQELLSERYIQMAADNDAWVAPVGNVWQTVMADAPLYAADGSHPSIHGTYLAACTFFAVMFNESPVGAAYPAGVTAQQALAIQEAANEVVFGNLELWNMNSPMVWTSISSFEDEVVIDASASTLSVEVSINGVIMQYEEFPIIISIEDYENGEYIFTATSTSPCGTSVDSETVVIANTGVFDAESDGFSIQPNPASTAVYVRSSIANAELEIRNMNGQLVHCQKLIEKQSFVPLENLPQGIYILRLSSDGKGQYNKKLVISY